LGAQPTNLAFSWLQHGGDFRVHSFVSVTAQMDNRAQASGPSPRLLFHRVRSLPQASPHYCFFELFSGMFQHSPTLESWITEAIACGRVDLFRATASFSAGDRVERADVPVDWTLDQVCQEVARIRENQQFPFCFLGCSGGWPVGPHEWRKVLRRSLQFQPVGRRL